MHEGYNRDVKRTWAILVLAGACVVCLGDAASDAARAELARERRRLASDVRSLADTSRRLEQALNQLASASRVVADSAARGDPPDEVARREDAVSTVEQEVRSTLDRRRLLADRVIERRRTIAALESDSSKKTADALTGKWTIIQDPGEQKGSFRLNLDGTIVSGDYALEGGFSGSLRGTLVSDRLRLERVDSELGFSAVYYGRVARDWTTIVGTWESTELAGGAPSGGRWRAVREEEKEEGP